MDSKLKAVVIDDDNVSRLLLKRILTIYLDLEVYDAENGEEGLRRIREKKPDLVVLDIMMPFVDGFQVLASLRSDPAFATLPVIVSSAVSDRSQVLSLLSHKVDDYIVKPVQKDEVIHRVSAIVQKIKDSKKP
jgi:DNA-binding response OmpR family regulator